MPKDFFLLSYLRIIQLELWVQMIFIFSGRRNKKNELNPILIYFINSFAINYNSIRRQNSKSFFLEPYEEKTSYTFLGGVLFIYLDLSQWAVYRIVAIDVRSRREGRDLRNVGFYDPIKNQSYLNVPAILYFLEKGAQPTGTVRDLLKKAEVFK